MTAAAGAMSRCRRDASNQVSFDFGRNIAALKRQADDLLLLQAVTELTSMERESMALESCRLSLAAAAPEIAMPCSAAKADQLAPPDQTIVATTLRAAIQGNSHTHLSYGFDQWIAAVKTRDDPMSKAMLYLANREIARGWSIVEELTSSGAKRKSMHTRVGHMLHRDLSSAFNTWSMMAIERNTFLETLIKVLNKMTNCKLIFGFDGWRAAFPPLNGPARRAIKSMSLQSLRAAMNSWAAMSEARQRSQQALLSAVSAFRGDGMRKAWNGWLGLLHDRQVMASAVYCMSLRLQRTGFASWLAATEVSQQLRSTLSSLSPAKRSMRKAINSWSEYGNALQSVRRATAALRMREERVAFSTWHEHVCSNCERDAAMRCAVSSMLQSSMRASLNTWMSYAEEHAEASRVLAGALSSLQPEGRAMRSALNTWAGVMMQRRSMVVAVASLIRGEQLWGLRTWSAHAALVRRQRERVEETARRAIKSMSLQSLRAAMNSWAAMSEARQRSQQALLSAVSAFRGDGMRKAWNGWLGLLHEETMSKKALLYVANREMARGWVSWHMRLAERASMRKSLVYLLNRELSQALGAWAEMAVERAELMRKFCKGAAFIINRELSRSWLTWYLTSVELARKEAVLRRGLRYLLSCGLTRGLSAWSEMAAERSSILQTLRKVVNRLANNKLELCFVRWLTRLTVQTLATMLMSLGHMLNRDVSRAFSAWSEMAMVARDEQVTLGTSSTPVQRKKLDASQSKGVSRLSRSRSYVKRKYKVIGQVLSFSKFNLARALGSALEVVDDEVLDSGAKATKSPKGTRVLTSFALRIKVPITVELERFSLTDVQLLGGLRHHQTEAGTPKPIARRTSSDTSPLSDTSPASPTQSLPVIHVAARYEAVYESTDCGNKVFVASIALKPPLYPGAELTALVPPTGRRIAFIVPASVPAVAAAPAAGARAPPAAEPKHADSVGEARGYVGEDSRRCSVRVEMRAEEAKPKGVSNSNEPAAVQYLRSNISELSGFLHQEGGAGGNVHDERSFAATAVSAAAVVAVAPAALQSAAWSAPPAALGGVTVAARAFSRATAAAARVEAARAEVAKAEAAKAEAAMAEVARVDAMGVAAIAVVAKVAASVVSRAEVARAAVAPAQLDAAVASAAATTPTIAAPACAAIRRARMHRDNSPTAMGRCSSASPTPRAVAMDYITKLEQECSGEDQADNLWI